MNTRTDIVPALGALVAPHGASLADTAQGRWISHWDAEADKTGRHRLARLRVRTRMGRTRCEGHDPAGMPDPAPAVRRRRPPRRAGPVPVGAWPAQPSG